LVKGLVVVDQYYLALSHLNCHFDIEVTVLAFLATSGKQRRGFGVDMILAKQPIAVQINIGDMDPRPNTGKMKIKKVLKMIGKMEIIGKP
jgi:hypothetical protein